MAAGNIKCTKTKSTKSKQRKLNVMALIETTPNTGSVN